MTNAEVDHEPEQNDSQGSRQPDGDPLHRLGAAVHDEAEPQVRALAEGNGRSQEGKPDEQAHHDLLGERQGEPDEIAGDDVYEGLYYVQGASAHAALSFFHDKSGNDRYNPTFPTAPSAIGMGQDFSAAIHLDEGGDDIYRSRGTALGTGYSNGIGILVNVGGTDVFEGGGALILGAASVEEVLRWRAQLPTIGVFVKAGGSATYKGGAPVSTPTAGGSWGTAPNKDKGANEKGVGLDRPEGTAVLP